MPCPVLVGVCWRLKVGGAPTISPSISPGVAAGGGSEVRRSHREFADLVIRRTGEAGVQFALRLPIVRCEGAVLLRDTSYLRQFTHA